MLRFVCPLLLVAGCAASPLSVPEDASSADAALTVSGAGFIDLVDDPLSEVFVDFNVDAASIAALHPPSTCIAQPPGSVTFAGGYLSAGPIVIDADSSLMLAPDSDGSYAAYATAPPTLGEQPPLLFRAGETISLSAGGGAVPAFGVAFAAPDAIQISTPDPSSAPTTVDRTQDLHVTWAPAQGATVRVTLGANDLQLTCDFDAADGEAVLPGAEIDALGDGAAWLTAIALTTTHVAAGAIPVDVRAVVPLFDLRGNSYSYPFTLE